ncbi:head GIN domain-containing protein [Echinicola vietnamensis]|uniref:Putative auto-transporter adhesin head GIN domain-containing protein n=1 Tax=Echinicola vietnamensis (strain DSM 17526 / LMG 23754 / KMM 6221) TaxID=926556 RepID=L0FY71_ECHVK|nr:head GIN domain-containing protein [Echinicola vietnamensis]AGA78247.1 Protein of unknown function (DUF2807) [Echinicola vietnamensis DSM 17526]
MKRTFKFMLAACLVLAAGVVTAQTNDEVRSLSIFNGVEISNSIEAELVRGDRYQVEIFASGTDVSNVVTEVDDRQLQVKMGKGNFGSASVKVIVTYAGDLDKVQASTSARVFVKDVLDHKSLALRAETSSYIETKVNVAKLSLEGTTNAKIFVEGTAEHLKLEAYTKADISGENLQVEKADVKTNTAAKSIISVSESIKGSAGTAGKVVYIGDPRVVDVKTNTGGDISRKE